MLQQEQLTLRLLQGNELIHLFFEVYPLQNLSFDGKICLDQNFKHLLQVYEGCLISIPLAAERMAFMLWLFIRVKSSAAQRFPKKIPPFPSQGASIHEQSIKYFGIFCIVIIYNNSQNIFIVIFQKRKRNKLLISAKSKVKPKPIQIINIINEIIEAIEKFLKFRSTKKIINQSPKDCECGSRTRIFSKALWKIKTISNIHSAKIALFLPSLIQTSRVRVPLPQERTSLLVKLDDNASSALKNPSGTIKLSQREQKKRSEAINQLQLEKFNYNAQVYFFPPYAQYLNPHTPASNFATHFSEAYLKKFLVYDEQFQGSSQISDSRQISDILRKLVYELRVGSRDAQLTKLTTYYLAHRNYLSMLQWGDLVDYKVKWGFEAQRSLLTTLAS